MKSIVKIEIVMIAVVIILFVMMDVSSAAIIYVPDDYKTIQGAIDAASPGDTVIVRSGIYYENVHLNKQLSLIGEGMPTIDARGIGSAITITANNTLIKGFRCVNTFSQNAAGIKVESDGNIIRDNVCKNNVYFGILLWNSSKNIIFNNTCEDNGGGIHLRNSSENRILMNTFVNCGLSIGNNSDNNEVSGNMVNGRPLVYLEGVEGVEITDAGQVILVRCKGVTIRNCFIHHTTIGIELWNSLNCTIKNNKIYESYFGILLWHSSENNISNNTCENNYHDSIGLRYSSNNKILNNTCKNARHVGISLEYSWNNKIYSNTFTNCGLFVSDSCKNEVSGNMVNGRPLVYLEGVEGVEITDAGQVILVRCKGVTVRNCFIHHTTIGIELWNSFNCTIKNNKIYDCNLGSIHLSDSSRNKILNNTCENGDDGIHLGHSSKNMLSGNKISGYDFFGISLWHSTRNKITNNKICKNGIGIFLWHSMKNRILNNSYENNRIGIYLGHSLKNKISKSRIYKNAFSGIYLWYSSNNNIYLNNFNNSNNVCSYNSDNIWISLMPIVYVYDGKNYTSHMGNYWSDYTGEDVNGNGVGDDPYIIDDDRDYRPLMHPWEYYNTIQGRYEKIYFF